MTLFIQFAILGVSTGSLYGLAALGIVLSYRASGILNFASGATGAVGAFAFYLAIQDGWSWAAALPLGVVTGGIVGFITYYLAMRLLRTTSQLGKLVATLGIMASIDSIVSLTLEKNGFRLVNGFLPVTPIHIAQGITIGENRLILIGIAVVLAAGLSLIYKFTRFGLATSAVAENRRAASALGTSPSVIEASNFIIAGALASLAAILLAPVVGLDVGILSLLIVPAFAAAAVGRFSSFSLTMLGAAVIGIIESEMVLYVHTPGWGQAVPFIVIVAVVIAGGRARQARGDLAARLPLAGAGRVPVPLLVVAAVLVGLGTFHLTTNWLDAFTVTTTSGILGLSVVVITGYTGQLSLAQFALAGFGAWAAARLIAAQGLPFWLGSVIGILVAIPAGLLIALPALRVRGVSLAIVTLGLSIAVEGLIFNNPAMTGGFSGTVVPSPDLFGIDLDAIQYPARYALLTLLCFVGTGLIVTNMRRGRTGRRLLAVRANERAAASVGVGVYGMKIYAFGLGAAIAALAGILLAFSNDNVVFTTFDSTNSMNAIQASTIGGIGWASGSIVTGLLAAGGLMAQALASLSSTINGWFSWFPALSSGTIGEYLPLLAGVGVIQVLRSAPDGFAAQLSARARVWLSRWPRAARPRWRRAAEATRANADAREQRAKTSLELLGIGVRFGSFKALNGISLTVEPGEIVGVIGPNGAGKTTLLDAVTGYVKMSGGVVKLYGSDIGGWSPERRSRKGLVRSFQAVELFDDMSIRDNLLVASDSQSAVRMVTDLIRPGVTGFDSVATDVIGEFNLDGLLDKRPPELSHGSARLAGIARAMVTQPSVLLLDEPASGLDAGERRELKTLIRSLARDRGVAVVLIEHDVALVLDCCDRVMVLNFGEVIALGTPDEIREDPAVITAYLGTDSGAAEKLAQEEIVAGVRTGDSDSDS